MTNIIICAQVSIGIQVESSQSILDKCCQSRLNLISYHIITSMNSFVYRYSGYKNKLCKKKYKIHKLLRHKKLNSFLLNFSGTRKESDQHQKKIGDEKNLIAAKHIMRVRREMCLEYFRSKKSVRV